MGGGRDASPAHREKEKGRGTQTHGVLMAVPTSPPTVPAMRSLKRRALLVCPRISMSALSSFPSRLSIPFPQPLSLTPPFPNAKRDSTRAKPKVEKERRRERRGREGRNAKRETKCENNAPPPWGASRAPGRCSQSTRRSTRSACPSHMRASVLTSSRKPRGPRLRAQTR